MTELIKKLLGLKTLFLLGLTYTLFITTAFLLPISEIPKDGIFNDKAIHVILYIVLSFIWLLYYYVFNKRNIKLNNVIITLMLCFIYGIIIESIQELFLTSRHADILDILANTIGSVIGTLVFWNVKNRIKT